MKIGPITIPGVGKIPKTQKNIKARYPRNLAIGKKGNKCAAAENMSPESHERRMRGLFKAWACKERYRHEGTPVMTARFRRKISAKNAEDIVEIVREAREVQDMARRAADKAIRRLVDIVENEDSQDTAAIAAAVVLLDRGYGKANQTNINATVDANGKPNEVSGNELDARIAAALKRVEAVTERAAKPPTRTRRPIDVRVVDRDPRSTKLH